VTSTSSWTRPAGLAELFATLTPFQDEERVQLWSELVSRATAADTLALVHDEIDGDDGAGEVVTDFFQIWDGLKADVDDGIDAAADLAAHFEHLTQEQLSGLTDTVSETAAELRVDELVEAGELTEPTPEDDGQPSSDLALLMRPLAGRAGLANAASDLGIDPLGVTNQARNIAGSMVPLGGLNQMVPELAVVSLAASAGMRIKNGEPVADVKQWLVAELSTMGVANAAMVAVQLLSGLVVLRPLAILGAKWGRARAETSAQATVAIRAAREKLAPLVMPVADDTAGTPA
jgi:hypothetical protein